MKQEKALLFGDICNVHICPALRACAKSQRGEYIKWRVIYVFLTITYSAASERASEWW